MTTVKPDLRPEHMLGEYADRGCSVSPTCLACPLPVCKYDFDGQTTHLTSLVRDEAIRRDRATTDMSVAQLAKKYRVSSRTASRALSPDRQQQDMPTSVPEVHDVHANFKPSWGLSPVRYTA